VISTVILIIVEMSAERNNESGLGVMIPAHGGEDGTVM
jgi:hypothetical protein